MAVMGFVCYCPHLRLYQYKLTDTSKPEGEREADYKFDEADLEIGIATHLAADNEKEAKFLAELTGLARVNPHKYVMIDKAKSTDAMVNFKLVEPEAYWKEQDALKDAEV